MGAPPRDGRGKWGAGDDKVRALACWRESPLFGAQEQAALRCVEEIHEIAVSDAGFAALEDEVGASGAVELVLLAAFYEAVARLIQAFGVSVEPEYLRYLDVPGRDAGARSGERRDEAAP